MKALIAKLLLAFGLLGTALGAPLVPAGNGVISYAVFKDHATKEFIYQEIPDDTYIKMGGKDGKQFNPTATSSDGVVVPMLYSAQFPTKDQQAIADSYRASATSTIEVPPLDSFTDTDNVSLYQYLAPKLVQQVSAAIAFDAFSSGTVTGTSLTFAHTITGTNTYLACGVANQNNIDDVTGVTMNGTSMTQLRLASPDAFTVSHQYLFGLAGPTTGNVVVSRTTSGGLAAICQSYTGVNQVSVPDNSSIETSGANTNTSLSYTATTTSSNTWAVTFIGWQRAPSPTAGITTRASVSSYTGGDSNAIITSPYTMSFSYAAAGAFGADSATWLVLAPVTAAVANPTGQDLIELNDE